MFEALGERGVRNQVNRFLMLLPRFVKNEETVLAVDDVELVWAGFVLEATASGGGVAAVEVGVGVDVELAVVGAVTGVVVPLVEEVEVVEMTPTKSGFG
jgi:hypothetical protein